MSDLEYSVKDHIATLLLNRPEKKNAFTDDMLKAWRDLGPDASMDDVRIVMDFDS